MPDWLDFDRFTEWVSGEWWSYFVIFGVAVVDAFFPLVPSETLVVIGGNLASSGDLVLWLVILSAAAGAIVGDNISYWIGHFVGEKTVKRVFGSEKWHKRLEWAERDARRARRVHHPHRPLHPRRPNRGHLLRRVREHVPVAPLHRVRRRRRAPVGDVRALLGYFGGKTFEDHPFWGVALALGIALTLGFVVEAVRHYRQRRSAE